MVGVFDEVDIRKQDYKVADSMDHKGSHEVDRNSLAYRGKYCMVRMSFHPFPVLHISHKDI